MSGPVFRPPPGTCGHEEGARRGLDGRWHCVICDAVHPESKRLGEVPGAHAAADSLELQKLLLWSRANGFRLTAVEVGGITIAVDDLRIDTPGAAERGPVTPHGLWAKQLGLKYDETEPLDDDDPEHPGAP